MDILKPKDQILRDNAMTKNNILVVRRGAKYIAYIPIKIYIIPAAPNSIDKICGIVTIWPPLTES